MSKDFLRRQPLFEGLPQEDFDRIYDQATLIELDAGEVLIAEGDPSDCVYFVLDGRFEVTRRAEQQEMVVAALGAGEVIGEMALLRHTPRTATVRALTHSRLLRIEQEEFESILCANSTAALSLLQIVMERLQSTQAMLAQHHKLAGLGMLAAGLAHELNNPAAALRRSADQLRETMREWEQFTAQIGALELSRDQRALLDTLRTEMSSHLRNAPPLDPLARSDQEGMFQDWLDDHGVERSWELAPLLVGTGQDAASLDRLASAVPPEQLGLVVWWLGSSGAVDTLLGELTMSAGRVSDIVKAVKAYSFLDRSPLQEVDLHEGLENTLVILRRKIGGVQIVRDYEPDLPHIEAYGSELNQVWGNVIDNALDALQGKGTLALRTRSVDDRVIVQICDDGPGIPPELQNRIFEPFVTSKAPGKGTGLGLHIAHNIVVQRHHGQIRVDSQPGSTCFAVMLPIHGLRE